MKFEIPFEETIFINQTKLQFKESNRLNLKSNNRRVILGIFILLIGWLTGSQGYISGYIMLGFGIHYIANFLDYHLMIRKQKKKFFAFVQSELDRQKSDPINTIWSFDGDSFNYQDYKHEVKFSWDVFEGYRIIKSNLILDVNMGATLSYIIGEEEIGSESFNQLIEFVKLKTE